MTRRGMAARSAHLNRGILAASLLLTVWAGAVGATPIPISNSSFEVPDAAGSFIVGVPDDWTGSPGLADAFVEAHAAVGFSGGDGAQYAGMDSGGAYIYQDLGVAFAANTNYAIDLAGVHRSGFTHGTVEFGLFSSDAIGTDLGTAGFMDLQGVWTGSGNPDGDDMFNVLRDASALQAIGSGALGAPYSYATGGAAPTGNVVVFIRNSAGNRVNFDNVRLDASPVPEPATVLLLAASGAALTAARKRNPR